jgi:hypothetical protein
MISFSSLFLCISYLFLSVLRPPVLTVAAADELSVVHGEPSLSGLARSLARRTRKLFRQRRHTNFSAPRVHFCLRTTAVFNSPLLIFCFYCPFSFVSHNIVKAKGR